MSFLPLLLNLFFFVCLEGGKEDEGEKEKEKKKKKKKEGANGEMYVT